MAVISNNILAGASGQTGGAAAAGYEIERSLRFNSADSSVLSKSFSASNRRTWTWSGWVKRSQLSATSGNKNDFFGTGGNGFMFGFDNGSVDVLRIEDDFYNGYIAAKTTAVFRDLSAWYHIVLAVDTTQSSGTDGLKLWVNGELQTLNITAWSQNRETLINSTETHYLGGNSSWASRNFNGYLADVHFIDGLALPPSAFAEPDANGVWSPREYTNSNDGTTWSNYVTGNSLYAYGPTRAFDGNLGTQAIPDRTGTSTPSTLTFTPPSAISGKVGIYFLANTNEDDSATISINGTDVSSTLRAVQAAGGSQPWYYEFDSITSLSSIAWTAETGYDGWNVYGITIDGKLLVDGATAYGTNGFNLLFDDASSASALGTDSANGNDWTVNNILTGSTPSGSNVGAYLQDGNSSDPIANMFDGNSNSYKFVTTGTTSNIRFTEPVSGTFVVTAADGTQNTSNGAYRLYDTAGNQVVAEVAPTTTTTNTHANLSNIIRLEMDGGNSGSGGILIYEISVSGVTFEEIENPVNEDSLFDSPTNGDPTLDTGLGGELSGNYATLNPLDKGGNVTLSNGNLYVTCTSPHHTVVSTILVSSGKYYAEFVWDSLETGSYGLVGVANPVASRTTHLGGSTGGVGYNPVGQKWVDGVQTTGLTSSTLGDVIGIALDKDNNQVSFYKNNSLLFTQTGLDSEQPYGFAFGHHSSSGDFNFGQRPFAYTAPSGYKALCTANLPTPDIEDGSTAFDVITYDGTGASRTFTDLSFQPDIVWIKARNDSYWHHLYDAERGVEQALFPNDQYYEVNKPNGLTAFTTNGFTVGSDNDVNGTSKPYVAWNWNVDTAFTNASGSNGANIASSGVVNEDAGISIVKYTGTGTNPTYIYHGLSTAPKLIITKNINNTHPPYNGYNWITYSSSLASGYVMALDMDNAEWQPSGGHYGTVDATKYEVIEGSAEFGNLNNQNDDYIAYCFDSRDGFSAIGSYIGNGDTSGNGPFVYLGFRPKFVMVKNINAVSNWRIFDSNRDPYNFVDNRLFADATATESTNTTQQVDFLSNGFKVEANGSLSTYNVSGHKILYMAFAEHPFRHSRAR